MTDPIIHSEAEAPAEDDDDLGFFPSWGSLYWSIGIYTLVSILVLYWITVALDFRIS